MMKICSQCGSKFTPRFERRLTSRFCSNRCRLVTFGGQVRHGYARKGSSRSPEYLAWAGMKARCFNPASPGYKNYGARGITVCERWRNSFEAFLADMGPKP